MLRKPPKQSLLVMSATKPKKHDEGSELVRRAPSYLNRMCVSDRDLMTKDGSEDTLIDIRPKLRDGVDFKNER